VSHIHGKNAVIYLGAAGAAAINIGEQIDWSLDFDMAIVDVSPLNLTWKQYVKGMFGYSASFNGNFDTSSTQLWLASLSSVPEKFYLYPDLSTTGRYYYGTVWVQLTKVASGSTSAKASSSFKATGDGTLGYN
jgi:hypothetical protein